MFVLFTDFGLSDLYVGQMKAVLHRHAPGLPVVDLLHDVNPFDIRSAAYLLPAYTRIFGEGAVFVCVVDPGVGSERGARVVKADGQWFVGPDNGLFNVLQYRAGEVESWCLGWRPDELSSTFHGRDVFAPVAAELAMGRSPEMSEQGVPASLPQGWPEELDAIVYIDDYGNCITGRRSSSLDRSSHLFVNGRELSWARTFSEVPEGEAFWYENANGLVEIAVNQAGADDMLSLDVGSVIDVV